MSGPWLSPCRVAGCLELSVRLSRKCFAHGQADYGGGPDRSGPAIQTLTSYEFDVICLQCAQRRTARGTEDDANYTRLHLGPCAVCRGPQVVERSDLGGISSPSQGHSVTYDAGRAGRYGGAV